MGRYLRTLKATTPGRVLQVGPTPTEVRFEIDHATWHARLTGHNGSAVVPRSGSARVVRLDRPGVDRTAA